MHASPETQDESFQGDARSAPRPTSDRSLLQRPFRGEYPATALLDHTYPDAFGRTDEPGTTDFLGRVGKEGWEGHSGYDWSMPVGTELLAPASGVVIGLGSKKHVDCWPGKEADGQPIISIETEIDGAPHTILLAHYDRALVQRGDAVVAGQVIGLSGNSGCSRAPHLHLEIWRWGASMEVVDPYERRMGQWLWKEGEAPSLAPLVDVRLQHRVADSHDEGRELIGGTAAD